MKNSLFLFILIGTLYLQAEIKIVEKYLNFGEERIAMTKKYILEHYGKKVNNIRIEPKVIVLHWTGSMSFNGTFNYLKGQRLNGRKDIMKASSLNVSAHYMVDRDGTIYSLMPDNWMARHVIGLNYSAIGIENIGGKNNKEDLTQAQVDANIDLIIYLKQKYKGIEYLIGHYEYKKMEKTTLWLEKDKNYRTGKGDPGRKFTKSVRDGVQFLELKGAP